MSWRGPSATSTKRKWRRSARRRRGERADDAHSRRHRGAGGRRGAWRLRRRGARRSEAGACAADEGRARAGRAAAAGQALRAGALHGGGADRPVPSRAHRRRGGREPRQRQQARARSEPAEGAARVVSAGIDPDARHDHQNKEVFALVKAGPNLYRVRKGNYMGQNFGVVTAIDEAQIKLKELVQDGVGEWVERASALQLVEAPAK